MYARLLAFACLLSCSVLITRAEPTAVPAATLGVYLKADGSASSRSLQSMRLELRKLMGSAGIKVRWFDAPRAAAAEKLIVVELRGACQFSAERMDGQESRRRLASTAVADGKVLPFSWVDCTALDEFLGPSLISEFPQERDESYGRALGRLLAHEFYHILAQRESHTPGGISKTSFSVADLLANHFEFDSDALALLRRELTVPARPTLRLSRTTLSSNSTLLSTR